MLRMIVGFVALAVVLGTAEAKGFYVGTYGGWNQDDVISHPWVEDNSGFALGGVLGTSIDAVPGLRVEADVAFRQNEVDVFGGFLSVDHDTFTLMGNLVYDIPAKLGPVTPYVLAGVGYGSTQATFENVGLASLEASGVAWQLGAGLTMPVADGVTAGVGYRFTQVPEISVFGAELSDGSNHAVVAELRFSFN